MFSLENGENKNAMAYLKGKNKGKNNEQLFE